jgi:hypothetical protein
MNMDKIIILSLSSPIQPFLWFLYPLHKFNCKNSSWCKYVFKFTTECSAVSPIWMVVYQGTLHSSSGKNIMCTCLDHVEGMPCSLSLDIPQTSHMQGNHVCSTYIWLLAKMFETHLP